LQPALFPLGRWPGPGLHPLTLQQQAAVNAIVRDLDRTGLAAVSGPPGTGKTTLLRDVVAHVMVSRAELLSSVETPTSELFGLDLMDFAVVVASSNNAAVENAWGLMAARLGRAANRREFFKRFWWDPDWGLNDWLNLVAWPDAPQNRDKPLGKLAELDPPPRSPEALANWRTARDGFRQALRRFRRTPSAPSGALDVPW